MIVKRSNKAATINPFKLSPTMGGALALQGFFRSIPLIHGPQGCAAFIKQSMTTHFREPISIQTSAMFEMNVVFGSEENMIEALDTITKKHQPDLIAVLSTCLTEVAGFDVKAAVKQYIKDRKIKDTLIVPVPLPDFGGSLEYGYAVTVESIIDSIIERYRGKTLPRPVKGRVNLLTGSHLTPGDVMELKDIIASFGLEVICIPDISTSLSGHLLTGHTPLTRGGIPLDVLDQMLSSEVTIAVGSQMEKSARKLKTAAGIPYHTMQRCIGLEATDELFRILQSIHSTRPASRFIWQREHLLDTYLDAHSYFSGQRVVAALEPDHLYSIAQWSKEVGLSLSGLVAPFHTPLLETIPESIVIGDLLDLESLAMEGDLWISNSHGQQGATRTKSRFIPTGLPVYHRIGTGLATSVGYRGAMDWTIKCSNILMESQVTHHDKSSLLHG